MEFLSHLQSGVDEHKPSLFELLSEQQLSDLLPPSLRYLLALATHRHPRYLLRILNSFDEVYAGLALLVEHYYLTTYAGSFTEHFYGLKRERVLAIKGGEVPRAQLATPALVRESLKLQKSDIWKNLAVLVGLPYLKRRLDESYDIYAPAAGAVLLGPQYGRDQLPSDASTQQRLQWYYKWFLRKIYPHINAAYYISLLTFQLAYLFDGSKYPSPFLWLIGTRMRRLGEADYRAFEAALEPSRKASTPARPGQSNSIFHPRILAAATVPTVLGSLRLLLPASIFALKFLEWWHASDFARQLSRKAAEGLELSPPTVSGSPRLREDMNTSGKDNAKGKERGSPTSALRKRHFSPPVSATSSLPIFTVPATSGGSSGLCPICLEEVATATASPYGFVYCYVCIHKWVEGEHERQEKFMQGGPGIDGEEGDSEWEEKVAEGGSRDGRWESGRGRCAVSGKRILGGTEGLRRIVV